MSNFLPIRSLGVLLIGLVLFRPADAQTCARCEIEQEDVAAYNRLLRLSVAAQDRSERLHLPWGVPVSTGSPQNEMLLHQEEYVICYDADLRVPLWVAHRLTAEDLALERERTECFRPDPRLSDDESARCEDYDEEEGATERYDRGHLARSADFVRTESAMINTYILSNICPQFGEFNRRGKPWNVLENSVQAWALECGAIYVFTGAIFDRNGNNRRDADSQAARIAPENRVAIPSGFFKIVMHVRPTGFIDSFAVKLPHAETWDGDVVSYIQNDENRCTISEIERVTGFDFMPHMPRPTKVAVKAFEAQDLNPPRFIDVPVFDRRRFELADYEAIDRTRLTGMAGFPRTWDRSEPVPPVTPATDAVTKQPDRGIVPHPRATSRFQVIAGTGRVRFILIDTDTGKCWERVAGEEGDRWNEIHPPN